MGDRSLPQGPAEALQLIAMTTSATVPPIETAAPGLVTRAPEGAFSGARGIMLVLGVLGTGATLAGLAVDEGQFYFSWLVAFMFVLSIALGAMFFVLVQHAARAGWSIVCRRIAENMALTLPIMAILGTVIRSR